MDKTIWLTMFIGAYMRFLKYVFFGIFSGTFLLGKGHFTINGPHDFNKNGSLETLILNDGDNSLKLVEFDSESKEKELWSYNLPESKKFNDIVITDINKDGISDIVALLDVSLFIEEKEWLYAFLGNNKGFSLKPLKAESFKKNYNFSRPSNISIIPGSPDRLVVALGATIREVIIFEIKIDKENLILSNIEYLSDPNTNNGSGPIYVGSFTNNGINYLTLISSQKDELRISTFDIEGKNNFINSNIYNLKNTKKLIGSGIEQIKIKSLKQKGIILPFESGETFILTIRDNFPNLYKTNIKGETLYPLTYDSNKHLISEILKKRFNFDLINDKKVIPHSIYNRMEKGILLPPLTSKSKDIIKLDLVNSYPKENHTSLPNEHKKVNYNLLSPTLGDFLKNVKDNNPVVESDNMKIAIPDIDNDMESMAWADEAGFTKIDLDDYTFEENNTSDTLGYTIPTVNNKMDITKISEKEWVKNSINNNQKSDLEIDDQIDLYYVLAITPASEKRDRFIFDGEIPFGVSVNQIPPTGKSTHYKHGISADLKGLENGNEFDFAYSLRDAQKDSITTLKMVHDMQTNLVYMKRSVLLNGIVSDVVDSNSKSYQPEAFDPKLFEFPNYFFEGFPSSLDMDFTDKLIRFSFNNDGDSLYSGIYLSSTTPSHPSQSLAVFMEEGKLQAVRGEVEVYPNGKKRITTEFDLVGVVEPKVLFSRLIEEKFSEELKMKLLQGASLEEPLFGPSGKLPKITREPRLPEAQPDQPEFEIPINPKQSNIPKVLESISSEQSDSKIKDENKKEKILEESNKLKAIEEPPVPSDSLKLEKVKVPSEDKSIELEIDKKFK